MEIKKVILTVSYMDKLRLCRREGEYVIPANTSTGIGNIPVLYASGKLALPLQLMANVMELEILSYHEGRYTLMETVKKYLLSIVSDCKKKR